MKFLNLREFDETLIFSIWFKKIQNKFKIQEKKIAAYSIEFYGIEKI